MEPSSELNPSSNDAANDEEAVVRAEIECFLEADDTLLGEVYRGLNSGLSDEQIRVQRGNDKPNFVWNYKRTIRALLNGDLPTAPSVASQNAARFRKIIKTGGFSARTQQVLQERLLILESRVADPDAQAAEEKQALTATKAAEDHAEPGIYVYTLPHYIRYPYDPELRHTLLKVGHSGSSVIQRFNAQRRETVLPEDPILLRVYPADGADSQKIEQQFHQLLEAADHLRREGRTVGREWFLTTTKFLDAIASTLGLAVREVFDPDSLD